MSRRTPLGRWILLVGVPVACSPSSGDHAPGGASQGGGGSNSAGAGAASLDAGAGVGGSSAAGGGLGGSGGANLGATIDSGHHDAAGTGGTVRGEAAGASGAVGAGAAGATTSDAGASTTTTADAQIAPRADSGMRADAATASADGGVPEGAVVLFDGTSLADWQLLRGAAAPWRLVPANKAMEVVPNAGDIVSKRKFEDVFLHVEYMTPKLAAQSDVQARGNSGIYLKMSYELQVLETHDLAPMDDGCGAIYKVRAPLKVACFGQMVWNTYEIEFKAPRFSAAGAKTANARFARVTLNGVLIHDDVEVPTLTAAGQPETPGPQPVLLQDHQDSNTVQYRNIWAIPR